jgi:hypothetical protein
MIGWEKRTAFSPILCSSESKACGLTRSLAQLISHGICAAWYSRRVRQRTAAYVVGVAADGSPGSSLCNNWLILQVDGEARHSKSENRDEEQASLPEMHGEYVAMCSGVGSRQVERLLLFCFCANRN